MRTSKLLLAVMVGSLFLGGCATTKFQPDAANVSAGAQSAENQAWATLRRVSVESRNELRLLAKAQNERAQKSMTKRQQEQAFYQNTYVPKGFRQSVVFNYTGRANKAAQAIAEIAGYRPVQIVGNPPANPIIVNIHIDHRPLVNALHELGMQTGDRVKVSVYPASKLIMFKYRNRSRSQHYLKAVRRGHQGRSH